MTTAADAYTMLPYRRMGEIDYASLEFDADELVEKPDAMEQEQPQDQIIGYLYSFFTEFSQRPDVFLSRDTNICHDPRDLNVRVSPDAYLAFGVDARAIRPRKLYLPWEVGKPPDWALEVASESTYRIDIRNKPLIYARIGVPEYWMFDPTGGGYYGELIIGMLLSDGVYRRVELTTEPDGILKGYSPVLQLSLAWDEGWPRFYNPATGTYLLNWRESLEAWERDREALEEKREAFADERAVRRRAEAERDAALAELRRLRGQNDGQQSSNGQRPE